MDFGFPLDPDESILRVIHRHWASLVPSLGLAAGATLVAALLGYLSARYPSSGSSGHAIVLLLVLTMTIIAGIIIIIGFFMYDRNLLVYTNRRIIRVQQLSLFNRKVAQLNLLHIDDAAGKCTGILNTIFNYGDLQIEISGSDPMIYHFAPNPIALADETVQCHEECKRHQDLTKASQAAPVQSNPLATTAPIAPIEQ